LGGIREEYAPFLFSGLAVKGSFGVPLKRRWEKRGSKNIKINTGSSGK